jgi:hypothetical protein
VIEITSSCDAAGPGQRCMRQTKVRLSLISSTIAVCGCGNSSPGKISPRASFDQNKSSHETFQLYQLTWSAVAGCPPISCLIWARITKPAAKAAGFQENHEKLVKS